MVEIKHFAGKDSLRLDTAAYKNELGQIFSVTNLKYYVGNFTLTKKDGKKIKLKEYFLVKEDDPESKKIVIKNIPEGEYSSVDFILGVDSAHNCSGAQTGALDPVNAMFWTWNTGYIFLKLEGKSGASPLPGNIFEYHIGGYKAPANCIRKVELVFEKNIQVSNAQANKIKVQADVFKILQSSRSIDFSKMPSVTGKENATVIADNYANMFSVADDEK